MLADFDECNSTWNDCSAHAHCINKEPGYLCTCKPEYLDLSFEENRAAGRICIHPGKNKNN